MVSGGEGRGGVAVSAANAAVAKRRVRMAIRIPE
jgi:hypothetical protein